MKRIRVSDLPERQAHLLCKSCGTTFSAHRADYFAVREEHEFLCPDCDEPLALTVERLAQRIIAR